MEGNQNGCARVSAISGNTGFSAPIHSRKSGKSLNLADMLALFLFGDLIRKIPVIDSEPDII